LLPPHPGAGCPGRGNRIDWLKKGVVFGEKGVVFANKGGVEDQKFVVAFTTHSMQEHGEIE
jgi:hypothetical protein